MQDLAAILIVAIAAAFLMRRAWQSFARRRNGACGSCSHCPSASSTNPATLVTISQAMPHAKAQRREDLK